MASGIGSSLFVAGSLAFLALSTSLKP